VNDRTDRAGIGLRRELADGGVVTGGRSGDGTVVDRPDDRKRSEGRPVTARRLVRLLGGLGGEVDAAPDRDVAERRVCDVLVASGCYGTAFLAVHGLRGEGLSVRTSTGTDGHGDDGPPTAGGGSDIDGGPCREVLGSGEPRLFDPDEVGTDGWPADPPAAGSAAAVPVGGGEHVDSVLGVSTSRTNAFGGLECAGLERLAVTLGLRVDAARNRELLLGDPPLPPSEGDAGAVGNSFRRLPERWQRPTRRRVTAGLRL
jgi:hypothetical protein